MKSFTKYTNFVDAILDLPEDKGEGFVFREGSLDEILEDKLSYDELIIKAKSLAGQLQKKFRPGDRALAMCPPGINYVVSVVASLMSGIVLVPVYPPKKHRNNWQRLLSIVSDASPVLFFTTNAEYQVHLQAFEAIEKEGVLPVFLDECSDIEHSNFTPQDISADSLAYIQYTSGSTSAPKGLRVTHANILHNMEVTSQSLRLPEEKIFVSWLPFYHDMGLIGTLFQALYFSATYVFMSPFQFVKKPLLWLQAISDYRATISWAPNFAYDLCVDKISSDDLKELDLSCWKVAANMAEPVRPDTLERFFKAFSHAGFALESLCPAYGMAETTLTITASPSNSKPKILAVTPESYRKGKIKRVSGVDDATSLKLAGSGIISSDQLVIVVDPDNGYKVEDRTIGEIWVSGDSVTDGYFNWGGTDESAFRGECQQHSDKYFLKTGDLGFFDEGELYITGRKKDVVIIRGENYYPQDIEFTVQQSHKLLRKGCIAAFAIERQQQEVLIVVAELVKAPLPSQDYADVIRSAKSAVLNEYGLNLNELILLAPGSYIRTSSGKVQRSLSRNKYLQNELISLTKQVEESESFTTSKNNNDEHDLSVWLKHTLAELLKIPEDSIGAEHSFSDYGLDSMTATQYAGLIGEKLKRPIPLEIAYDYPNLHLLEKFLLNKTQNTSKIDHQSICQSQPEKLPAIIGMACRFPEATNLEQFWAMLMGAGNGLSAEGDERWASSYFAQQDIPEACKKAGFIRDIKRFDCNFFGVTPREAESMDPQQRFLLEVCYEAIEDAGLRKEDIQGSLTGVYVGISDADYARQQLKYAKPESYAGTGSALSIAANRLSYFWDFKGPSCAIDSACSSSLVALNAACQDLMTGEVDMAIVGAVNLLVSPDISKVYHKANMLAPDGICKVFDDEANGYVRGEGCGVVVLKRQKDATYAGDSIYSIIKASSVMQDGKSNGLSAPVGPAQSSLVHRTIKKAGLEPSGIDYIEAHGTGTALGDPIEVSALSSVFSNDDKRQEKLLVGSVKANIGHLESAAGMAGLIKTTLCLKNQVLPPQIHLNKPSNKIPWHDNGITILPAYTLPWPQTNDIRRAGVSSFGFGGTLAHAIVEQAPERERPKASLPLRSRELLCLSAKTKESLLALRDKYSDFLSKTNAELGDIAYTAAVGRTHFPYRLAVQGDTPSELATALSEIDSYEVNNTNEALNDPKCAWLFSGQGSQYAGMGKKLYATELVFREALDKCAALLSEELDYPLLEILWGEHSELIDETQYTQPTLFSLGYSLAQLWRSWGITPSVVMGHSVGEYIAACVAGVFDLASGIRLIAARGRLMQYQTETGAMAVVFAPAAEVEAALKAVAHKSVSKDVSIGAYNGPENTVVSGAVDGVDAVLDSLSEYRQHRLSVSRGFHSPLMDTMLDAFREVAESINYQRPSIDLVSNVTGQCEDDALCKASYWVDHVRAPVRFAESMNTLAEMNADVFLELGPSHTLIGMGRQCGVEGRCWASSLVSGEPDENSILSALSALYTSGVSLDWKAYYQDRGHWRVHLPTYAFQGKPYWFEVNQRRATSMNDSLQSEGIAISPETTLWQLSLSDLLDRGLGDHQVYQIPVCPGAFYVAQALDFYSRSVATVTVNTTDKKKLVAEGVIFKKPLTLENEEAKIQFRLDRKTDFAQCTVFSLQNNTWVELCSIEKMYYANTVTNVSKRNLVESTFVNAERFDADVIFNRLDHAGLNLAGQYTSLKNIALDGDALQASADIDSAFSLRSTFRWHLLIDNLLQAAVFHKLSHNNENQANQLPSLFVPFAIDRCVLDLSLFDSSGHSDLQYMGWANQSNLGAQQNFDLLLKSETETLIELGDVIINKLPDTVSLKQNMPSGTHSYSDYSIHWEASDADLDIKDKHGLCLVFSSSDKAMPQLSELNNIFAEVITVNADEQFSKKGESITLDLNNKEHWDQLVDVVNAISESRSVDLSAVVVSPDIEVLEGPNYHDCFYSLFALIKNIDCLSRLVEKHPSEKTVPLIFMTQASLAYNGNDQISNGFANSISRPQEAVISSLVHSLNHEYSWCRAVHIDLPDIVSKQDAKQSSGLIASLTRPVLSTHPSSSKNQQAISGFVKTTFAIRDEQVFEPRLVSGQLHGARPLDIEEPSLKQYSLYLVTGGLGELGLVAAKWLGMRGAKHIALLQRTKRSSKHDQAISELEQQGINIVVVACDISNRTQLDRSISQLQAEHGSIKGIVHAAGALEDSLIVNAEWPGFKKPFQTKVTGTLNLLTCLRQQSLDFCLLYSSITSLIGPPGQANYSMANSFLNALPFVSDYKNLNVKSIIWGPWKNLGMARDETIVERFREAFGVLPVSVDEAFSILDRALSTNSSHVSIGVEFDHKFSPSGGSLSSLFSAVFKESKPTSENSINSKDQNKSIKTLDELMVRVRQMVFKAMKLEASYPLKDSQTLQEFGMDSVMALELQSMLGSLVNAKLPATLFFDYPTINEVSEFIFTHYFSEDKNENENTANESENNTVNDTHVADEHVMQAWDASTLEQLTTDELEQMLANELSDS